MMFLKKQNKNENLLVFLCNLVSCWLITIATGIVFDGYFEMKLGILLVVWQTLICLGVVVIGTKNWRISIGVLGFVLAIGFVIACVLTDIKALFKYAVDFVSWWLERCPEGSKFYKDESFYFIHTLINIGVTILYYAVFRITKKAWPVVAIAFLVVGISLIKGYTNYDFWAIPFFVVGIFPLIAAEKFQNVKLPDLKNLFGVLDKKWLYIIVSTFVAVVICLTSVTAISLIKDSVRTRFCTDIVSDLQSYTGIYTREQKNRKVSLFDLGLVSDSTYIGGDIKEVPSGVLATTNLTQSSLVKIAAYDNFDGVNWQNDSQDFYRIDGPWEEEMNTYLSTRLIDDPVFLTAIRRVAKIENVVITIKHPSHIIPSIGQVFNFWEITENKNQVLFDTCGRLLSHYGQAADFKYSFDSVVYDTKREKTQKILRDIIAYYGNGLDELYNPESEFFKRYTQKIEGGEKIISVLIDNFNFDVENYYDKALKICEFFSDKNGFIYSNDVSTFEKGDNIIDVMFDTKKGHCLYYATTMIAMTRSVGIPSRLAAGYITTKSEATGLQVIDRANPYAWVECYIPHIGWVSFDPTPKKNVEYKDDKGNFDGRFENKQEFFEEDESFLEGPGTNLEWNSGPNIPLIIGLSILGIVLILALLNVLLSQKFYKLENVRKRYSDTKEQARFYYYDMLRQFAWMGFVFKSGETMKELGIRAFEGINDRYAKRYDASIKGVEKRCCEDHLPTMSETEETLKARESLKNVFVLRNRKTFIVIGEGIKVIEAVVYGDEAPSEEQIETIYKAHEALEDVMKNENNKLLYVVKRRLLLPIFKAKPKFWFLRFK